MAASAIQSGFTFDPESHVYALEGMPVISVTQVLSSVGLVSFDGISPAVLERKAHLGRLVHQACEFYDQDALDFDGLPEELKPYVEGYMRFRSDAAFVPELVEYRQVATVNGMHYGMTLDRTGFVGSAPHILELKTGADENPAWGVQLAAYEMAIPRPLPYRHYERAVVQLGPQFPRNYKIHPYTDAADAQVWLSALALATWKINKGI